MTTELHTVDPILAEFEAQSLERREKVERYLLQFITATVIFLLDKSLLASGDGLIALPITLTLIVAEIEVELKLLKAQQDGVIARWLTSMLLITVLVVSSREAPKDALEQNSRVLTQVAPTVTLTVPTPSPFPTSTFVPTPFPTSTLPAIEAEIQKHTLTDSDAKAIAQVVKQENESENAWLTIRAYLLGVLSPLIISGVLNHRKKTATLPPKKE